REAWEHRSRAEGRQQKAAGSRQEEERNQKAKLKRQNENRGWRCGRRCPLGSAGVSPAPTNRRAQGLRYNRLLPTASTAFPSCCLLPTAFCLLLSAFCLLPSALLRSAPS